LTSRVRCATLKEKGGKTMLEPVDRYLSTLEESSPEKEEKSPSEMTEEEFVKFLLTVPF